MIINFNRAKRIAAGCLAMSSCAFLLWVNQATIQADQTSAGQSLNVQVVSNQNAKAITTSNPDQPSVNTQDQGNYACLDQEQVDDNGNLTVTGWHATNASRGRQYHYLIAYNPTSHQEISRQDVTANEVARPDVAQVHNIYGAARSGFRASFKLGEQLANLKQVQVISRYTNDSAGNGDSVDYWFAPVTIDQNNNANLDGATVKDNQLELTGWHATNLAANKPYHYIIVIDRTAGGQEVGRYLVKTPVNRPDVSRAYPDIEGTANCGFTARFALTGLNFNHQLQAVSRYSGASDGNSDYVDYWFRPFTGEENINQGCLDSYHLTGTKLRVSGWHVNNLAEFEPQQFLILYDNTARRQVAVSQATKVNRPDVARVYPTVPKAVQSGFTGTFELQATDLIVGHSYSLVSRYSTSTTGNGGQGSYTDYWSRPFTLLNDQQAAWLDSVKMTNQGLQLAGWMISNHSVVQPYAYAIVLNNGREIARTALTLRDRPDVAGQYPNVYNSSKSGFSQLVAFDPQRATGNLKIILRFSNDRAGNGQFSDQSFGDYASNTGYFDTVSVAGNRFTVTGWHASDQSAAQPYQFVIVLNEHNQEVGRWKVTDKINRPDLAVNHAYLLNSASAGFTVSGATTESLAGQIFTIIHRFSSDPAGNSHYTDYAAKYSLDPDGQLTTGIVRRGNQIYHFDARSHQMTKNATIDGLYFDGAGHLVNGQFSSRVINWFVSHEGELTYSMQGSRDGRDGTADCSGSMTAALAAAGASRPRFLYSTGNIDPYLVQNGYHLVYSGRGNFTPQYGDIIIWREPNRIGHIMIISGTSDNPKAFSTGYYLTGGKPGTAVQEAGYHWFWNFSGSRTQYVYRLYNQARN